MHELYNRVLEFAVREIENGVTPLEIAAMLNTLSVSIYRTVLNEQDFERMVDALHENSPRVKPLVSQDIKTTLQ